MRILLLLLLLPLHLQALETSEVKVVGLFKNAAVINIQGQQRLLKVGQSSPEGIKLIDASASIATLEINGQRHQLPLTRARSGAYQKKEALSETIAINSVGQYFAAGSINGQPVKMLVDTGATSVAMNTVQARRLGIDFAAGRLGESRTAGGIVKSYSLVLDSVKVGSIESKHVRAAVLEGVYPSHVLLGMTFLKQVEMAENNGVMTLTKRY